MAGTNVLGFGQRRLINEIIKTAWETDDPSSLKFGLNDILYIIQEMHDLEGRKYLERDPSGGKTEPMFKMFVRHLLYRNLANYDSMVLITSEKGCITGDGLLDMPRDLKKYPKGVPLKDLAGKGSLLVNSFNVKKNRYETRLSDGVEFVKNDDVYELELTNGMKIQGTSDHPFMLMDGSYKQLKDLRFSDRLRINKEKYGIVESLNYIGKKDVYDVVNVRDNHNFIVNGFVISNTGKSNASIVMARHWCQILGIRFDPKRHMAYNNRDVMERIKSLNNFEPIIADESVRFASTSDWATREAKELRKRLAEVRTKHLLFILCFPLKIYKMEKTYLESFVNYWCVTGDTKITYKNHFGVTYVQPIEKLLKRHVRVLTYNTTTKDYEFKKYKDVVKTKENADIWGMMLENNSYIKCTEEHPFLTQRGWVRLKDLKSDDKIRVREKTYDYNTLDILVNIRYIKKLKHKADVYDIIGVEDNHNYVANNMVVHNCDLFGRGLGAIYVKDRNPVNDSWRMKDFKNVGSYTEFTSLAEVEKKLKKHPNFWQIVKFPKVPSWLYEKYLVIREKNVYDEASVRDSVTTEDVHRALLLLALQDIMMNDTTLNLNRISLHIKNTYDIPIAKKSIQEILADSKQLVTKIREEQVS